MDDGSARSDAAPWYADGLRFECQQTGRCCTNHGEHAYVYVTDEDELRLMSHFGLSKTAFRRKYTRVLDGLRVLRDGDDACYFLDGHGCSVYEARPVQCRTWPFWRSNLDVKVWNEEVVPFCAGAGRGRKHTRAEIDHQASLHDEDP